MVGSKTTSPQELSASHLNTFLQAIQTGIASSKLGDGAKEDLLKTAPHEFLPIMEIDRGDIVPDPQRRLPTTLGELKDLVQKSKRLSRDGNRTPGMSEHAEQLEYNRIFDGAITAVEKAMGKAR